MRFRLRRDIASLLFLNANDIHFVDASTIVATINCHWISHRSQISIMDREQSIGSLIPIGQLSSLFR